MTLVDSGCDIKAQLEQLTSNKGKHVLILISGYTSEEDDNKI